MKKIIPLLFFLLSIAMVSEAQITWLKITTTNATYTIEEGPDGSFIAAMDTTYPYLLYMDKYGNPIWTASPQVRTTGERINCAAFDFNGNFIVGGESPDTTLTYDEEPFVLRLDSTGASIDYQFYPPGDVGGRTTAVLSYPDSGYAIGIFEDDFGGSNHSEMHKIDTSLSTEWSGIGSGSDIKQSAMIIDPLGNILFGAFGVTPATLPTIHKYDSSGALLHSFTIPDTFAGGSLNFNYPALAMCDDGNYFVGATISPFSSSYTYPYFAKLDTTLNPLWEKTIDWGQDAKIRAISPAAGNGLLVMLTFNDEIYLTRYSDIGDSLWSQHYAGILTADGSMIRRCMDMGYIVGATTQQSAYILKLDSLARVLPPVNVSVIGAPMICQDSTVTLVAPSGYQYMWSTGDTTDTITVHPGTYTVTVIDMSTGDSAISPPVVVSGFPQNTALTINGNLDLCMGDSVELVSPDGANYMWNNSQTTQSIYVTDSGSYSLSYTDTNGCVVHSDTAVVIENPVITPVIVSSVNDLNTSTPATSYQWFLNDTLIPGADSAMHTPLASGDYTVVIVDTNGCIDTSAAVYFTPVGIASVEKSGMKIYQSGEKLLVSFTQSWSGHIALLDQQGRVMIETNIQVDTHESEMDISKLSSGIYFVRFRHGAKNILEKILITK